MKKAEKKENLKIPTPKIGSRYSHHSNGTVGLKPVFIDFFEKEAELWGRQGDAIEFELNDNNHIENINNEWILDNSSRIKQRLGIK